MAPYQYEPLGSPTSQIRLLELLPGRGTIRCRLKVAELDEAEFTYEPISYCWKTYTSEHWWGGSYKEKKRQKTYKVVVDGLSFYITESLESALRQMRYKTQIRLLWADAICINQADDEEKSAQVALMGKIYQSGSRTLVWLGDADCWTKTAFALMRKAAGADLTEFDYSSTEFDYSSIESDDSSTESGYFTNMTEGTNPPGRQQVIWKIYKRIHSYLALHSIINRPYFERAWIVQEVVMSSDVSAMCGKHKILGDELYDALYCYGGWLERSGMIHHGIVDLSENRSSYCLDAIISKLSHTKTSDPRDKLYSALGLHQDCEDCGSIVVDYSKDVDEVFLDATRVLLLRSPFLRLLSMSYGITRPNEKDIPSWMWNPEAGSTQYHLSWRGVGTRNAFQASWSSRSQPQFRDRMLGLHGYPFDVVQKVGNFLSINKGFLSYEDTVKAIQCYLSWVDVSGLNEQGVPEAEARTRTDAFRRALKPFEEKPAFRETGPVSDDSDAKDFVLFHAEIMKRFGKSLAPRAKTKCWSKLELRANIEAIRLLSLWESACLKFLCHGWDECVIPLIDRCFVATEKGIYGLCPRGTMPGDRVFLLQGAIVPLVLRPSGEKWVLVGECYIHGAMYGELWDPNRCEMLWIE